jgi:hypothetical protein
MKRTIVYLALLLVVAFIGLWGCPKKTKVTSAPEATPAAEAAKQAPTQEQAKAMTESSRGAQLSGQALETEREHSAVSAEGLKAVYFDFDRALIRGDQRNVMSANGMAEGASQGEHQDQGQL